MPIILNIESSTDICSICLSKGDQIIALKESSDKYSHSSVITIFIEQVLKEANYSLKDIDAIALSQGPGSYTALRIGTATAKGICYALDKPLIAIDTLQALALATHQRIGNEHAIYFPMIDARRMEVYTAGFDAAGEKTNETEALIVDENAFSDYQEKTLVFAGNGASKCKEVLRKPNFIFDSTLCSSKHLVPLAHAAYLQNDFVDVAYFSPDYFKSPNITTPKRVL